MECDWEWCGRQGPKVEVLLTKEKCFAEKVVCI